MDAVLSTCASAKQLCQVLLVTSYVGKWHFSLGEILNCAENLLIFISFYTNRYD